MQAEFVWHKLSADNMDPDFVERRRVGLENFLLRVASHPVLSNDKILYHFLTEVHAVALGVCNIWPVCISVICWLTEKLFTHLCARQEHGWKEVVYDTGFQAKVLDFCGASFYLYRKFLQVKKILFTQCNSCSGRFQTESSQCHLQGEKSR